MNCSKITSYNTVSRLIGLDEKPKKLVKVLEDLLVVNCVSGQFDKHISAEIQSYINDLKSFAVGNRKIKQVLEAGASCMVFETPSGNIIKLSRSNPFPENRPAEDFEAKIFKRCQYKDTYYLLEEKLQDCKNNKKQEIAKVRKKIKDAGYNVFDLDDFQIWQIGVNSRGEIKLRDHGCAIPVDKNTNILKRFIESIKNEWCNK